jgi:transglutaminase-like putative cysteine protease
VSFYVMMTAATMIVCGEAFDSRLDQALPVVVAAAGVLAFFTVDQNPQVGIPRPLANVLALGSLGILVAEYRSDDSQLIRYLGHWLIYLQMIKYSLPKTAEDDWFLFLLGLTQVLIGSVVNQGDMVGAWLFLWAMLAVWVLGLFFLQREARRFATDETPSVAVAAPTGDPYRGLLDLPYAATTLRMLVVTLFLGGLFFLLLPRQAGATRSRPQGSMSRHLTGFDEEVKLGQMGEILENDTVVMSVEFSDEDGTPIHPQGEPLFRGVTLTQYEQGRWRRQLQSARHVVVSMRDYHRSSEATPSVIRQTIKLEPNDSPTLFAMRPILEMEAVSRLPPQLNPVDGTIFRSEPRGPYDYTVVSGTDVDAPQEGESPISPARLEAMLGKDMDRNLRNRLREIALPIVKDLPEKGTEAIIDRARALESYLRESGEFSYTLEMSVSDHSIDPVLDFVINRKRGHCEYFASALALMLRSVDIPCRLVNGFKGGDWNDLTQSMNVRQKHAHSWVEALIAQNEKGVPTWVTLDPTPATGRDESVAQVGGVGGAFRPFLDILRYVWVFYILGYDSNRQNRLIYEPIRTTVRVVREGYGMLWDWTRQAIAYLFRFPSFSSFISIRGFFVSFIVLLLVAFLGKFLMWLGKRVYRWWRGPQDDSGRLTAGILFYRRLTHLLAAYELERDPSETQAEFALRAARSLNGLGTHAEAVAQVPQKIVDAFYRVRFGHRDLDPGTLKDLEASLDLLQQHLNNP